MPKINMEDQATRALVAALDGLAARQRVIGNNLANVDTPGFKASEVSFARQLEQAMGDTGRLQLVSTDPRHMGGARSDASPEISATRDTSQRLDGNNVDMEKEMVLLAETVLHFQAVSRVMSRRLGTLRTVIYEGKR